MVQTGGRSAKATGFAAGGSFSRAAGSGVRSSAAARSESATTANRMRSAEPSVLVEYAQKSRAAGARVLPLTTVVVIVAPLANVAIVAPPGFAQDLRRINQPSS